MTTTTKTPRLLEAAKEFNIGKETLVAFLADKGFELNSAQNSKLTEQMYNSLQVEFAQDKLAKRKSDEIALPKGSLLDNLRKNKDEQPVLHREKKEEPAVVVPQPVVPPTPVAPQVVVPPAPVEVKPKPVEVATPSAPVEKPVEPKHVAAPVAEKAPVAPSVAIVEKQEVPQPQPQPVQVKEVVAETVPTEAKPTEKEIKSEPAEPEHVEIKAPKIEGPNILGKINLDELNLASRPKKGAVKKTDKPAEIKSPAAPTAQPTALKLDETPAPQPVAPKPVVAEAVVKPEPAPAAPVKEEEAASRPEHIEMKAPRLEGPKIIGKIELPVSNGMGGAKGDPRGEKRKRKRIPVDKRAPDPAKNDPNGTLKTVTNDRSTGGVGRPQGRGIPSQGGYSAGPGGPGNRPGGPGNFQSRDNRPGGGPARPGGAPAGRNDKKPGTFNRDAKPFSRDGRPGYSQPVSGPQQEIDTKAIQDKIRETQAKLTGSTRSKNLKAKYRRNKRDEMAERRAAAENSEMGNVIQVTEFISVSELASLLDASFADVISKCMGLGIMVSINQRLDAEVIELVSSEFGYVVEFINLEEETEE